MDIGMETKIKMALSAIYAAAPFDASFLHSMSLSYVDGDHHVKTAATDCSKNVWISTDFIKDKDYKFVAFVLCHEARHKVFEHTARRDATKRDPQLDNMAADYVINNGLLAEGHTPTGATPLSVNDLCHAINTGKPAAGGKDVFLADSSLNPHWGVAEVYAYILSKLKHQPSGGPSAEGGSGIPGNGATGNIILSDDAQPSESMSPEEKAEVQVAIASAFAAAKAMGKEPLGIGRVLTDLGKSRTDWRERLHTFARLASNRGVFAADWTYRRPSRRYPGHGPITPSILKPPVGEIVIGIDTSGSIGERELAVIGAEVRKLHEDTRPIATHIVWCDSAVAGVQTFGPDDTLDLEPKGGGGTAFEPVFKWVRANVDAPMYVVYFSDGLGSFSFDPQVPCPTLWAITTDVVPPWGERVGVDLS